MAKNKDGMPIHDVYVELCRQLGLKAGSIKPSRKLAKEHEALLEAVQFACRYDPERTIRAKKKGRPYQGPSASFMAFAAVNKAMNAHRIKSGVKRVPAAITDKLIDQAVRLYVGANESSIRRHLRNDRRLLPFLAVRSKA
jgi:hypothetical protein